MDLGISGRIALVLGSTSGLGLAIAQALAAEGVRVALCGRRGEQARQMAATMEGAVGFDIDLTNPDAASMLTTAVSAALGSINIVVLNSGGPAPGTAATIAAPALDSALDTLLIRQIQIVSTLLPGMTEQGWGRIVGIGSSGIQQPIAGLALSNIARAGLAGYLKTLAGEVGHHGITVNMVLPGRIDTERVAVLDQLRADREQSDINDVQTRSRATIPVGRYGTAAEFAAVVSFLCSTQASYVTGEQVRCDGGLVAAY